MAVKMPNVLFPVCPFCRTPLRAQTIEVTGCSCGMRWKFEEEVSPLGSLITLTAHKYTEDGTPIVSARLEMFRRLIAVSRKDEQPTFAN